MSSHAVSRIVSTPWAIHEPALQTIVEIAQRHAVDPANLEAWKRHAAPVMEAVAFKASEPLPGARSARLRGQVAIVPIVGPIFRYANLFTRVSGATAVSDLASDFGAAMDNPAVRSILLVVDSPGGEPSGIAELADGIRAASARKPVVAYIDGMACSAAYWLAAAAREVVVNRMAIVGSLGVIAVFSQPAANAPIEIVSSQTPGKRPKAHTEEGRATWQALVDKIAEVFLGSAAGFRGMTVEQLLARTNGGGMLIGSDAVRMRLADRVAAFEDTAERLAGGAPAGGALRPAATAAPVMPPTVLRERERCVAIQSAMQPGMAGLAETAIAAGWSLDAFTKAQEEAGRVAALTPEQRARAAFATSPALQAEFRSVDRYVAFAAAEAAGRVRLISGGAGAASARLRSPWPQGKG